MVMPRLSLTMKEGTVIRWYKKEGDRVERGEPLVEVLSEKVTYDVEAPSSGVLRKILTEEGVDVPVNGTLAIITAPGEPLPEGIEEEAEVAPAIEVEAAEVAREEIPAKRVEKRVLASPAAKRLAREHDVDLTEVAGTGPEGKIVERDVIRFIEERAKIAPRVREVVLLTGIRKTAAERVALSAKTAPHSTITMEVDMTNSSKLRRELQLSYTEILVKAVSKALREHPLLNSSLEGDRIKIFEDVNVGVAVATSQGLVVPVIRSADNKSLGEIASELRSLVEKARKGSLTREDVSGGTFTITNLGMYGVDVFTPIINPPQTAILGVGRLVKRPVVVNQEIEVKPLATLSLSFDHRVVDGAPAARFLGRIKELLENSEALKE